MARVVASLALLIVAVAAVPRFYIDLDAPPEERWSSVVKHYDEELPAMMAVWQASLDERISKSVQDEWLSAFIIDDDYLREMQGIVDVANHPDVTLDRLKLWNNMYELNHPTFACSGMLFAMPNGTVIHGRNMDYVFMFNARGKEMNWPDVTYEAEFSKGGKPLFISTQWPGHVGVDTAMRYDGWSFEQNTRIAHNEQDANLVALKEGRGETQTFVARRVMETVPDFETAVKTMYDYNLNAPSYFIMAGAKPWEGAILSMDRNGQHMPETPPIQRLDAASHRWFIIQTNDDAWHKPLDERSPYAHRMLIGHTQAEVDEAFVWSNIRAPPVFNDMTVFTTLSVPALNRGPNTLLPSDPYPGEQRAALAQIHSLRR